jgi:VWFA-related protein
LRRSLLFVFVCCAFAQQQPVFRSQTRLVEVDVVVRDSHGPVTGLTKDDFTLYDCKDSERDLDHAGLNPPCRFKKQPLAVFREVKAGAGGTATVAAVSPLPPGTVSNRMDSGGKPIGGATIVVIDQLNTPFTLKGYQRLALTKFFESAGDHERVAVYSLGDALHLLQGFTSDPKKLIEATTRIDAGEQLNFGDGVTACLKKEMTDDAVRKIIHDTAGITGRKNLLWLAQGFLAFNSAPGMCGPPVAGPMLGQANIATYPVMVRSLVSAGIFRAESRRSLMTPPPMRDLDIQYYDRKLGESLGGEGFKDANEISTAFRTAQDDSSNYYVLGFYPAESDLGGGTHQLTVDVPHSVSRRAGFGMRYRQTYRAAKPGTKGEPEDDDGALSLSDIFRDPLDAAAIGLSAAVKPDPERPGANLLAMTIDLTDIQLRPEGDRWVGTFQVSMRLESHAGEAAAGDPIIHTVNLNLTNAEFETARRAGLQLTQSLPENTPLGFAHIVVQSAANGAVGSLRVPIADLRR